MKEKGKRDKDGRKERGWAYEGTENQDEILHNANI